MAESDAKRRPQRQHPIGNDNLHAGFPPLKGRFMLSPAGVRAKISPASRVPRAFCLPECRRAFSIKVLSIKALRRQASDFPLIQ